MSAPLCLGIDVGSTLCKAIVCDAQGTIVAAGRTSSPAGPHGPAPDDTALNAWWQAVCQATRAALSALPAGATQVRAVGTSCRHHPGIFLDARGAAIAADPVPPLTRADPEMRDIYDADGWGPAGPLGCAYAPLLVGTARWLARHHPDRHRLVRRAGALRDYLTLRLCDVWVTDYATGPGGPVWPPAAAALAGVPVSAFPASRPMHACAGRLTPAAAAALGLERGIPVAVGAQDGACATFGAGAADHGDGCITLSTNAVVRIVTGLIVPGAFGYPIAPSGAWAWVRGCTGAGRFLDAVVSALDGGPIPADAARHAALTGPIGRCGNPSTSPPFTLPDRDPTPIPKRVQALRDGGWTTSAIYAAAAAALVDALGWLIEDAHEAGIDARRYALTGGLTALPSLRARIGAALQAPIVSVTQEAAGTGAARLAAMAAGIVANAAPGPGANPTPNRAKAP